MPIPRFFIRPILDGRHSWKPRWLLWLEGIGHRTCLAVQQQRLRYTDSNADLNDLFGAAKAPRDPHSGPSLTRKTKEET